MLGETNPLWPGVLMAVASAALFGLSTPLVGAAVLSWPADDGSGIGWGAVLILGACLAWGIDNNLTRKFSAADPVQIATIKGLAAGGVNLALALGPHRLGEAPPLVVGPVGATDEPLDRSVGEPGQSPPNDDPGFVHAAQRGEGANHHGELGWAPRLVGQPS